MTSTQPTTDLLNKYCTPWSLHFDRDGTEDIGIIRDANGDELVQSRHFWLPEGNESPSETLLALQLMVAAPTLLALVLQSVTLLKARESRAYERKYLSDAKELIAKIQSPSSD